jgi:outer membrane protein OmpA-like peptidoglycan-associated protein
MSRFFKAGCIAALAYASSLHAEEVLPLSNSQVTVDTMAELLAGPGVSVSGATYSTSYRVPVGWFDSVPNPQQGGQFSGYGSLFGDTFDSGVILSTGDVESVVGSNDTSDTSKSWFRSRVDDPDLGNGLYDVVKFSFDVIPENDVLIIDFIFGSEEYLEYVGDSYNDLARVLVNGNNCALTPAGDEVRINNIHSLDLPAPQGGNDYPNNADGVSNSGIYVDNTNGEINTEMDGFTRRLSCRVPVTPGQSVNVITGLADVSDASYDTWIFFRADSIRSEPISDYGDAPDSYGTLASSGGAAHDIVEGVRLGPVGLTGDVDGFVDGVDDSQGRAADDADNALDTVSNISLSDTTYSVTFAATSINGSNSDVVGWIDFDRDGQFQPDEAAPAALINSESYEVPVTLTWSDIGTVGADIVAGPTYLRLRIANLGLTASTPSGLFASGEVEDYFVIISDGNNPSVVGLTRLDPAEEFTNSSSVTFRVSFSEYIENIDATDFVASFGTVASVTSVSETVFDITVSGISGANGTLSLSLSGAQDIVDAEGNAASVTLPADAETYTLDQSAPAAPVVSAISADTGLSDSDQVTNDASLTFSGTAEAGSSVSVRIDGNEVATVVADASGNWSYDYPGTGLEDGTFSITATATDNAGNTSVESDSLTVVVDTVAPAPTVITGISEDTGRSNSDALTKDAELVLAGQAEANQRISVFVDGNYAGFADTDPAGAWTYDHTSVSLSDGEHVFTAVVSDAAGNTSTASAYTVTVDTEASAAPVISAISDDTGAPGDGITSDNTLRIFGTAEALDSVVVSIDGNEVVTVQADGNGDWVYDNRATTLDDGNYVVTAVAVDAAGNESAVSSNYSITIDTSGPATPAITGISNDTGVADGITADATLLINGSGGADSRITVFLDGAAIGTTNTTAAGSWTFDHSGIELDEGNYQLTAQAESLAGLTSPLSVVYPLIIDQTAPDAPVVTSVSEDTGVAGDQVTSDATLVLNGTAEAGADLDIRIDGALVGMVKANGSGEWTLDYSDVALADGVHQVTAIATDIAGNQSVESSVLTLIIDTQAPDTPILSGILEDTGASAADAVTSDNVVVYVGTAEAGSHVEILLDGSSLGSTQADESGQWQFDSAPLELADGTYQVIARSRDLAGNETDSQPLQLVIDTTAPVPATVTGISEDTATPNDRVTADNELVISGSSEPFSEIEVFINGIPAGIVSADDTGLWQLDYTDVALTDGEYQITNQVTDLAGNTGVVSAPVLIVVDTTTPEAPSITGISDDTGADSADGLTSDNRIVISGESEAGAEINIYRDESLIGNVIANASGEWSLDYGQTALNDGEYSLTATATDTAGNLSGVSEAFDITIDTLDPTELSLAQGGTTIVDYTPELSGDAEAGTLIKVSVNGSDYETTADAAGGWSLTITDALDNGSYPVTVVSEDGAGNTREVSGEITIEVLVSAENSSTSATPLSVAADGSSASVITVIVRDTAGDVVTEVPAEFATDLGTLSAVTDQGNGVYSVELTSLFEVGTATVSITAATEALTPVMIEFFAADGDGDGLTDLDEDRNGDGDPTNDDLDRDGTPDYLDDDDDGDGRTTEEEDVNGDGDPTNDDSDGDGIPDYLDRDDDSTDGTNDSDGDGIPDTVECPDGIPCQDSDADGTPDYMDEDDDNDGISSAEEGGDRDTDADGVPDFRDEDDDNDGILTRDEDLNDDGDFINDDQDGDGIPAYLDPNDADDSSAGDSDDDGIPDDIECASGYPCTDTDSDGIPDFADSDDDGDGIPTLSEGSDRDTDGDATPDYLDRDDDGDGIATADEDNNTDGDANPATTAGPDADNDGIPAYLDPNDSLTAAPGDADDDGITDDRECASGLPCRDSDNDGRPDYMDSDDDNDGIPTRTEGAETDSDGNGVEDYLDNDDDGDGTLTRDEDADTDLDGNAATNPGPDADSDGIPAYLDPNDGEAGVGDSDGDGIADNTECGTALPCQDTDFDGIPDFRDEDDDGDSIPTTQEAPGRDTDGDNIPDYLDADDDGDDIPTPTEDANTDLDNNAATNAGPDSDGDGIPAYLDANDGVSTSPGDGDGDGIPDNIECSTGVPCIDRDFDGVPDYMDADDDGDGIPTADEDADLDGDGNPATNPGPDGDDDGVPDYLDPDSTDDDGDGLTNLEEDANGDGNPDNDDLDRDGVPDYLDPDDDGDGRTTLEEDLNGNGDPRDDDADGDGIPAYLDPNDELNGSPGDADEDGIFDDIECDTGFPCRDTDGDGLPDYLDSDDDNDGVPSSIEGSDRDTDNDGIADFRDADDDGDGVNTRSEDDDTDGDGNPSTQAGPDFDEDTIPAYLDPNDSDTSGPGDSDNDTLSDLAECQAGAPCEDSDQDGQPDYNDPDDDNDGRLTVGEDPNADGNPANDDTDGDGTPDYLDRDDDGDGIPSDEEGNGDADSDGIPDYLDPDGSTASGTGGDSDGDGINDITECPTGIPCRDTDGDGTPDYADDDDDNDGRPTIEEGPVRDTDGDGIPDYRDEDDDNDGFNTIDEGTGDSDGDGIPDYLDPSAGDSDEDGVPDGAECPDGVPCRDTDADGIPDYLDEDDDGDGIPSIEEDLGADGNPVNDDTDGDGQPDYLDRDDDNDGVPTDEELGLDADNDGIPDYLDPDDSNEATTPDGSGDSDRDGVSDARECPTGLPCPDSDGNGAPDYLSEDDDGDGIPTVDEDRNGDGDPLNDDTDNDGRPDYRDPDDDGDGVPTAEENEGDSDFDGIPDYLDPSGGDSDRDGISDAVECPGLILCWDSDGDDLPNFRDPDDDGDGVSTAFEDADGDGNPRNDDTDNDGIPDYLDPDDDNDGILTVEEGGTGDVDDDGIPDYRDPDSNNAAGMPDGSGDSDGDGISDRQECGTGAVCADSDGDGTPDYMQVQDAEQAPELVENIVPGKGEVNASLPGLGSQSLLWVLLGLPLVVLRRRAERHKRAFLKPTVSLLVGVLVMFAPLVSQAFESEESYVGLGLGFSRLTPGTSDSVYDNVDESGFGFQLFGGYRLKDDISVELHYTDLGNAVLEDGDTGEESDFGYSALGAALHWYPWQTSWNGKNSLNAYLEAGLASISTDSDVDYSKEASMALGLGIGIEYSFKDSWAARISGQSFTRDAHFVGLSIMKRFGTTEPVPQRRPVVKPRPLPKPEPVKAPVVIMADSDDDGIVDDIDDCPGTPSGMSVNHRGCSVLDARLDGVYFASGSAELTRGATRTLEQVADTLMEYPDARIEIGAYTDSLGAAANNQRLSERRANAVMQYLIDMGINPMRLEARGYGEEDPIASNDTAQGRAANRRVEIRVIK